MIQTIITVIISLSICSPLLGQAFQYPVIPNAGSGINGFKPDGWEITDTAFGDLNKDGRKDVALVLQYQDTVMEILPPVTIAKPSIPRILVIAFQRRDGGYSLATQNNLFLLRSKEIDVPGESGVGLSIDKKEVLHIHYILFHGDVEYKFRYQKSDFYLIGYDQHGIAGGESMTDEYNFLTKKHFHESYFLYGNKKPESGMERITAPPLQSFKTFIRPGTWPEEEDGMVLENRW